MAFEIGQNALRPLFVVALKDNYGQGDEAAVNLTTAGTAYFNMGTATSGSLGGPKISRGTATITDAATGEVTYAWATGDTDTPGDFYAQVEIIWNDGKSETFPGGPSGTDDSTGYWSILIHPEIDT